MSELNATITKLGFKEYEAKVYAALVGLGEGTAKQIHNASGVPRPRVYDILEGLVKDGFVEVRQGVPMCYKALEPCLAVSRLKSDMVVAAEDAIKDLQKLSVDTNERASPIWHVRGERSIRSKFEHLVARAEKELLMVWYDTRLLKEEAEKVSEAASKKTVVCLFAGRPGDLAKRLGAADVRAVSEVDFMKMLLNDKVFKGKVKVHDADHKLECLIVADGEESIIIYDVNMERMAITIKLPLITFIQRAFIEKIMSDAKSVA